MKDLLKLYSFESVHSTDDETAIADWICKWLDAHGVTDYTRSGNSIYRFDREAMVILSAHLDQVKTNGKAVKLYMSDDEIITAYNNKWQRTSLGADDKNGIWIILKAIEAGKKISFIISEGEEVGCVGINNLQTAGVLENNIVAAYHICLVLDRRGNKDILNKGGGTTYCSTLAQSLCNFLGYSYEVTTGSISDTAVICKYCESVNMSVAYDKPHTANESTDFKRLKEIKDDVIDVIDNFVHYSTDPSIYSTVYKGGYNYGK